MIVGEEQSKQEMHEDIIIEHEARHEKKGKRATSFDIAGAAPKMKEIPLRQSTMLMLFLGSLMLHRVDHGVIQLSLRATAKYTFIHFSSLSPIASISTKTSFLIRRHMEYAMSFTSCSFHSISCFVLLSAFVLNIRILILLDFAGLLYCHLAC